LKNTLEDEIRTEDQRSTERQRAPERAAEAIPVRDGVEDVVPRTAKSDQA
jgi:hypothetical protein